MNSEQIIKTLGYLTLILIAVYVLFGMLDMGGKGLTLMAKSNKIVEGMDDRKLDRIAEKLGKKLESIEDMEERYEDLDADLDDVEDLPEFKDLLDNLVEQSKRTIRSAVKDMVVDGNMSKKSKIIDEMHYINALSMVSSGGAIGGAAKNITGGFGF